MVVNQRRSLVWKLDEVVAYHIWVSRWWLELLCVRWLVWVLPCMELNSGLGGLSVGLLS